MVIFNKLILALQGRFQGQGVIPGPSGDGLLLAGTTDMYLRRAGSVGFLLLSGQ